MEGADIFLCFVADLPATYGKSFKNEEYDWAFTTVRAPTGSRDQRSRADLRSLLSADTVGDFVFAWWLVLVGAAKARRKHFVLLA